MIKGIDNKKVEMSDEEFKYYGELIGRFGAESFKDLFSTDDSGKITIITPKNNLPAVVLYFVQNLQQNQYLREFDKQLAELTARITKIESKIKE